MNKLRYHFFIIFLYFSNFSNLTALPRTIQISIAKSGTHLLIRCIRLLSQTQFHFTGHHATPQHIESSLGNLASNKFLVSHIPYSPHSAAIIKKHQAKVLFTYRDPRDLVISFANYIRANDCSKAPNQAWPMARNMSFDDIINSLIEKGELYHFWPGIIGIDQYYKAFMPWAHFENCLPIRFEDLIGPKGGGSLETQYETIKTIAQHLQIISLPEEKFLHVIDNLFGGESTFRQGQIGAWKTGLNKQQKELFKKVAGKLLIDLGYENDMDW